MNMVHSFSVMGKKMRHITYRIRLESKNQRKDFINSTKIQDLNNLSFQLQRIPFKPKRVNELKIRLF